MMYWGCCSISDVAIQVLLCYRVQAGERLMSWLNYSTTVAIPWLQLQHLLLFSEVLVQCQCDLLWRLNVKRSVHSTKNKTHQNKKSLYNQLTCAATYNSLQHLFLWTCKYLKIKLVWKMLQWTTLIPKCQGTST